MRLHLLVLIWYYWGGFQRPWGITEGGSPLVFSPDLGTNVAARKIRKKIVSIYY